tara:strand:- start:7209 stop:7967 length:759 start_codon:yes stop_codon:yes gene_type:complete
MSMKLCFCIIVSYVCILGYGEAKASDFAVEIAARHIDVTVGFTGSSIELFGDRRNKDTDIAIVVEGPRKDITIWKKARVMGTWVNRYYLTFKDMPVYYHYASTIPQEIDDNLDLIMRYNGIGHPALFTSVDVEKSGSIKDVTEFQDAFLKEKEKKGVYFDKPAEIKFINDNFFRVRFDIPASAQTGEYKIRSYLIENDRVVEQRVDYLKVEQVGVNALVYKMAHDHSLFYALACIGLALFCGWFASVVRVRP